MILNRLHLGCRKDFLMVRDSINDILEKVTNNDFMFIEVALNEAVNNAFKASDKIVLTIIVDDKQLIIKVKDFGGGFNYESIVGEGGKINEAIKNILLKESGRGLFIIKHLVDSVEYNEKGNVITMIKHINQGVMRDEN